MCKIMLYVVLKNCNINLKKIKCKLYMFLLLVLIFIIKFYYGEFLVIF